MILCIRIQGKAVCEELVCAPVCVYRERGVCVCVCVCVCSQSSARYFYSDPELRRLHPTLHPTLHRALHTTLHRSLHRTA